MTLTLDFACDAAGAARATSARAAIRATVRRGRAVRLRAKGVSAGHNAGDGNTMRWPLDYFRGPARQQRAPLPAGAGVALGAALVAPRRSPVGPQRRLLPEATVVVRLEPGEVEDVRQAAVGRGPRVPEHPPDAVAAQPALGRQGREHPAEPRRHPAVGRYERALGARNV